MKKYKAQISKIESFSTVDGPGIRSTYFFSKCKLRCKFCHNPETWTSSIKEYTVDELYNKIIRNKAYFKNNGGVTFSGGEPLLHSDFLIELCKKLKKEKIHITLDTSGIGNGNYNELLKLVDLVMLDIKHITKDGYKEITQKDYFDQFKNFVNQLNKSQVEVWIRQVIIPDVNDNKKYIKKLASYLKNNIKNINKVEFLPFHTLGFSKYEELKIKNPYKDKEAMDNEKCKELYDYFTTIYKKEQ